MESFMSRINFDGPAVSNAEAPRHELAPSDARDFILAGNAIVTLQSRKTSVRFTYRVRRAGVLGALTDDRRPWFVSVLNGPDNEEDYVFLGTIFWRKTWGVDRSYYHGRKSRIVLTAPSAKAFAWAWELIAQGKAPPDCEVWHEGRCGKCGRTLTVPESIARGLGPICARGGAA
jgi:hypothetical protein